MTWRDKPGDWSDHLPGVGCRRRQCSSGGAYDTDTLAGTGFARYVFGIIRDSARMIQERGGTAVGIKRDITQW